MSIDDPNKPEFASWQSYQEFAGRVRHTRRYVWTVEIKAFLDTVIATLKGRDTAIKQGSILYRAQRGIEWNPILDESGAVEIGEEPIGFGAERMKPLPRRALEGRTNPAGIPLLYLASTEQTAISEVRPWVGSHLSVAQFKVCRNLKAVNLSLGHGQHSFGNLTFSNLLAEEPVPAETKEKAVWIDIDNAFSKPVTLTDDAADYVPTQILAELFREAGYDAIVYRSQFGDNGYNIAVFNVQDADPINCAPYTVSAVEVKFKEIGSRWFSVEHKDETGQS